MLLGLSVMTALSAFAQKPVYLDTGKPIEERVKDALNRMTLEEKVKMIHAQSKFSSAGVPRLGIPEVWATDGPHGIRPEVLWDEWDTGFSHREDCLLVKHGGAHVGQLAQLTVGPSLQMRRETVSSSS